MFIYVAFKFLSYPVSFSMWMKGHMNPTEKFVVFVSKLNSANIVITLVKFYFSVKLNVAFRTFHPDR
jgi:hypothetical protein